MAMQSTSESERDVTVEERAPHPLLRHWKMAAIAVAALGADQLTKFLIRSNMRIGESWPEEGFLRLTHGTNTGSAFGLFQDQTLVLTIASVVAIGFVFLFYRNDGGSTWMSWLTSGLILGGAFGNLIDRVVAGKVTDFIDVGAVAHIQHRRLLNCRGHYGPVRQRAAESGQAGECSRTL